jgi:7-carboxy-7-deazaguanine synthase
MTVDEIVKKVADSRTLNVTITGGEPLMQRHGLRNLIKRICLSRHISIETNGSYAIINWEDLSGFTNGHDPSWIVDYKLPSSGESKGHKVEPWLQLTRNDYIKFVIADRQDYDITLAKVQQMWWEGVDAQMVFSPVMTGNSSEFINTLYGWMQENQLFSVVLNVQLHKIVGLKEPK